MGITLFEDLTIGNEYPYTIVKAGFLDVLDSLYLGRDTTVEVILEEVTSVATDGNEQLRIFPVPANHLLTIESQLQMDRISIMDFSGREVYLKNVSGKRTVVDIGSLESGSYILHISLRDGTEITKEIKVL